MSETQEEKLTISKLIEVLRGYKCVPFVGAGISRPSGTPTWSKLIQDLGRRLRLPKRQVPLNTLQIPGYYEQRLGRKDLLARIRDRIQDDARHPNDYHRILLTLPFRTYVTTNWDTLIEKSVRALGIEPNLIRDDTEVPDFNEYSSVNVVKMHGCITRDIVVTEHDYWNFSGRCPLLSTLVRSLLATRSMLFLGFSFSDPNVGFVFHDVTRQLKGAGEPSFVVFVDEDPIWAKYCKDRLRLEVINLHPRASESTEKRLLRLLNSLKEQAQIHAYDKVDRADLLLRETRRAVSETADGFPLRIRASLGPFGSPRPKWRQGVFGNERVDRLEWELNDSCQRLLQKPDGQIYCMLSFSVAYMQGKGYHKREARARLSELLSVYERSPGLEIVEIEEPIELNQFFIADHVGIESVKTVSGKLYNHATVTRDRNELKGKINQFDLYFEELKRLNARRASMSGFKGSERLRQYIIKRLRDELQSL